MGALRERGLAQTSEESNWNANGLLKGCHFAPLWSDSKRLGEHFKAYP
jgi:hypothetical protein